MEKTLGIIVNSSNRPEYVIQLAAAARAKQKSVRIHFAGPGVLLADAETIQRLAPLATISVCLKSADEYGRTPLLEKLAGIDLGAPNGMADLVSGCDRFVVF